MTAVAAAAVRPVPRVLTLVLDTLLLGVLFTATFEKVHWSFGGAVSLADVLAICYLVSYAVLTRPRVPRSIQW